MRELPPDELAPVKVKDPAHWDVIIGGMVGVTNDPAGRRGARRPARPTRSPARPARRRCSASDRTRSTSESDVDERLRDHALFIAFAPADAPKLAVAVLVENGRSGSGTAAPIARKVFDAYLLPPDGGSRQPDDAATPPPAGRSAEE